MYRLTSVLFARQVSPALRAVRWRCSASVASGESVRWRRWEDAHTYSIRTAGRLKAFASQVLQNVSEREEHVPESVYHLVKSCGSELVLEKPEKRQVLLENIWKQLKKKGLTSEVGLYNTLLQVYMQNDHKFPPSEFMEKMREDGIMPNQGTLVLFLQAYCNQGNMQGAMQILERMKSLDLAINENVYASLITGHARADDIVGAEKLLHEMGDQITPGLLSFTALLCAYAERGDMASINRLLGEMRERRLFPSVTVYTKIIDRLSQFGHSRLIPEVLDLIKNKKWMRIDFQNLVVQLAMRGESDSALLLFHSLGIGMQNVLTGRVVVRSVLQGGAEIEEVLRVVQQLRALGITQGIYEDVLHELYQQGETDGKERGGEVEGVGEMEEGGEEVEGGGKVEGMRRGNMGTVEGDILAVMRAMHANKVTVKPHYFYPLLAHHTRNKNFDGVLSVLDVMQELRLSGDVHVFRYCLEANDAQSEDLIVKLKEKGLVKMLSVGMVQYFCMKGLFEQMPPLFSHVSGPEVNYDVIMGYINSAIRSGSITPDTLVQLYNTLYTLDPPPFLTNSIETAVFFFSKKPGVSATLEMLKQISAPVSGKAYQLLLNACLTASDKGRQFFKILDYMKQHDITIEHQHQYLILRMAALLGDDRRAREAFAALDPNQHAHGLLISALATSGHVDEAKRHYSEVFQEGKLPLATPHNDLSHTVLREGDLATAEAIKKDMQDYPPNLGLRNAFIEAYAQRGDIERMQQEFQALLDANLQPNQYTFAKMMDGYAYHGDYETIRQLMTEMTRYQVDVHRSMTSSLVTAYLSNDMVSEAMAILSEFPSHPPYMSALVLLLEKTMARKEEEEVQRVVDLMLELKVGQKTVDDVLFYARLKAGDVDGARAIMTAQNGNFEIKVKSFIGFATECSKTDKLDSIRAAIDLVKGQGNYIQSDEVCTALIRGYKYTGNVRGALELQKELRKAGRKPTQNFKKTLSLLLATGGANRSSHPREDALPS